MKFTKYLITSAIVLSTFQSYSIKPLDAENQIQQEVKPETNKPIKGYWGSYAPQFMQNAATSTKDYVASWIPQSVKDRVNTWSTKKKLTVAGAVLSSLLGIYNKDQIIKWMTDTLNEQPKSKLLSYKEKKALGLPTTMSIQRSKAEQDPEYIKKLQRIANDIKTDRLKAEQPLSNKRDEAAAQKLAKEILQEYYDTKEDWFGDSKENWFGHDEGYFVASLLNRTIYEEDTPIMNRARAIALQTINPQRWEDEYNVFH